MNRDEEDLQELALLLLCWCLRRRNRCTNARSTRRPAAGHRQSRLATAALSLSGGAGSGSGPSNGCLSRSRPKEGEEPYDEDHPADDFRVSNPEEYDDGSFEPNYPVTKRQFVELLSVVGPLIAKQNTRFKMPIDARTRLSMTLRYLAYGDTQVGIAEAYGVSRAFTSRVIAETTKAIWKGLESVTQSPSSPDEWLQIAGDFQNTWNMIPNCLGVVLSTKLFIKPCAKGSKSEVNIVSVVATCDVNHAFTTSDVQTVRLDTGSRDPTLIHSDYIRKLEASIPIEADSPYSFMCDETCPSSAFFVRPFPGTFVSTPENAVFNYRSTQMLKVGENAFGVMAARWRVLRRPLQAYIGTAVNIVRAVIALHNYLCRWDSKKEPSCRTYCPPHFVDFEDAELGHSHIGDWRQITAADTTSGKQIAKQTTKDAAMHIRQRLAAHFQPTTEEATPWQSQNAIQLQDGNVMYVPSGEVIMLI